MNNPCECTISVVSASQTYPQGTTKTGSSSTFVSTTSRSLGPWFGESTHFQGTDNGAVTIFDYQIDCNISCWIMTVTIEGAAFSNSDTLTFYNENKQQLGILNSLNGGNTFQSHTLNMSSNAYYGNSFQLTETNTICCWRYRSLITMTMLTVPPPLPIPTACNCTISLIQASNTYSVGTTYTGFTSESINPLAPWYAQSVQFRGTSSTAGGDLLIYEYDINCVRSCWITSIAVTGAAFQNSEFTLWENKSAIIDTLNVNTGNVLATHTLDMSNAGNEFYAKQFKFTETNDVSTWRYRELITMTVIPEPTENPTKIPTVAPTAQNPTLSPASQSPTIYPTDIPTVSPTKYPTKYPSVTPTKYPTKYPSVTPSKNPTENPTKNPTVTPSKYPTKVPTVTPSKYPTKVPSVTPSKNPTEYPTLNPAKISTNPTLNPTRIPSRIPSNNPTLNPSQNPTISPTQKPTNDGNVNEEMRTTYYHSLDSNDQYAVNKEDDNSIYYIIGIIGCICLCFCILCVIYGLKKKQQKQKHVESNLSVADMTNGVLQNNIVKETTIPTNTSNAIDFAEIGLPSSWSHNVSPNVNTLSNFAMGDEMMMDDIVNQLSTPGYIEENVNDNEMMASNINGELENGECDYNNDGYIGDMDMQNNDEEVMGDLVEMMNIATQNGYNNGYDNDIDVNENNLITLNGYEQEVVPNLRDDEFIINDDESVNEVNVNGVTRGNDIQIENENEIDDDDDDIDFADITPM